MTAVLFRSRLWPEQKKIELAIWMHDAERKKSLNLFAPSANNLTDNFFFVGMIETHSIRHTSSQFRCVFSATTIRHFAAKRNTLHPKDWFKINQMDSVDLGDAVNKSVPNERETRECEIIITIKCWFQYYLICSLENCTFLLHLDVASC